MVKMLNILFNTLIFRKSSFEIFASFRFFLTTFFLFYRLLVVFSVSKDGIGKEVVKKETKNLERKHRIWNFLYELFQMKKTTFILISYI